MSQSEIEKLLASYFKGVDASVVVTMVNKVPYLDIQYEDFKPVDVVQEQIRAIMGRVQWLRCERTYSKSAILEELWRMYNEDVSLFLDAGDSMFRMTQLPICVQERMETRKFTHLQ